MKKIIRFFNFGEDLEKLSREEKLVFIGLIALLLWSALQPLD
jgi:hypothetical protein